MAEPDVHLVATLLSLNRVMPNKTKATTRKAVTQVVEELERKLAAPMCQAVSSSLNRAARKLRPRHQHQDIDWLRDIVLCVDQSGSMASSVVYAGVFAAVLASIKAVSTSVVVFDTVVADLAPLLSGPVEVLFGTQLGGGTDINRALAYCQGWWRGRARRGRGGDAGTGGRAGRQRRAGDRAARAERCGRDVLQSVNRASG